MREWESAEREHEDIDRRLSNYYGPELPEQSLPQTSWMRIESALESRRTARYPRLPLRRLHSARNTRNWRVRGSTGDVPTPVKQAFTRILLEAQTPLSVVQLLYVPRAKAPGISIAPLRRAIKLFLPSGAVPDLVTLDVLLATAVARYYYQRKLSALLTRFAFVVILAGLIGAFLLFPHTVFSLVFLIAAIVGMCIAYLGLLHVRGRSLAFRADALMVQWLGRTRACQGLHTLANQRHAQRRGRWREPSLAERIDRVCGSQITSEDERLTLVR